MNKKYFKPLVIIIALIIVCITTIVSYAYFVASVSSNASANVITTGNMEVTYENGQEVGTTKNMIPGDYETKTFSVTNTGDVYALYDIYLNEVINTFVDTDELVYELISEDGVNLSQRECPTTSGAITTNIGIEVGQTHHYTLKITFLNKDYSQDDNQGKMFNAKIELKQGIELTAQNRNIYYFTSSNTKYNPSYSPSSIGDDSDYYVKTAGISYEGYVSTIYGTEMQMIIDGSCETLNELEDENNPIFITSCEPDDDGNSIVKYIDGENNLFFNKSECEAYIDRLGQDKTCTSYTFDSPKKMPYYFDEQEISVCIYSNHKEECISNPKQFGVDGLKSQEAKQFKTHFEQKGYTCEYDIPLESSNWYHIVCKDQYSNYSFTYSSDDSGAHYTVGEQLFYSGITKYELRKYNFDNSYATFDECFDMTQEGHNCRYKDNGYYDYKILKYHLSIDTCNNELAYYTNPAFNIYPNDESVMCEVELPIFWNSMCAVQSDGSYNCGSR